MLRGRRAISISLEGAGLAALGFAQHRANQAVEQIDGLISQAGGKIHADGDERRMPTLPLVTSDVLHRGTARLAGGCARRAWMNHMSMARLDTDRANMFEALGQAGHGGRFGGSRQLPRPTQPTLAAVFPTLNERIKPPPLIGRHPPTAFQRLRRRNLGHLRPSVSRRWASRLAR
jgi:hypothetical protein